jgi:hypothetical protein
MVKIPKVTATRLHKLYRERIAYDKELSLQLHSIAYQLQRLADRVFSGRRGQRRKKK